MTNQMELIKGLLEQIENIYLSSNATSQQKIELLKLTNSNNEWFGSKGVMQYVSETLQKSDEE